MDITFLTEYAVPLIIGICLCLGYILKNVIAADKINKYIPLIMGVTGVVINIWMNKTFTPTILLGGLMSGLTSTGLYEAFKNLMVTKEKK